jgi:N-acylneuraminate cytidylyltransferase
MINGKAVLAIIPARGGSKGLPRKNVLDVGGKPMIAWSVESAKRSRYVDRVVLSTDDMEIAAIARRYGCDVPFMRPPEFARDDSLIDAAVIHTLDHLDRQYDYFVLLEPTTPLRTGGDIDACIELCLSRHAPVCISISEPPHSPYWAVTLENGERVKLVFDGALVASRRQELATTYMINGGVYVADTAWYRQHKTFLADETVAYVMPPERSFDIDSMLDLVAVNAILEKGSL